MTGERTGPLHSPRDLATACHELSAVLNRTPPCYESAGRTPVTSCLALERQRFVSGKRQRPLHRMKLTALCPACAAAWHVQMAAIQLDTLARWDAEDHAAGDKRARVDAPKDAAT